MVYTYSFLYDDMDVDVHVVWVNAENIPNRDRIEVITHFKGYNVPAHLLLPLNRFYPSKVVET